MGSGVDDRQARSKTRFEEAAIRRPGAIEVGKCAPVTQEATELDTAEVDGQWRATGPDERRIERVPETVNGRLEPGSRAASVIAPRTSTLSTGR